MSAMEDTPEEFDSPNIDDEFAAENEAALDADAGLSPSEDDVESDLEDRIEDLESRVEVVEERFATTDEDALPFVFPANLATDGTWQEICVGAGSDNTFTSGVRFCNDSANAAAAITLTAGQTILLEITTSTGTKYINVGSGTNGDAQFLLVAQNGTDGDGNPTYDVFAQDDPGLTTPLNSSPLAPECSRARWQVGATIIPASDGTMSLCHTIAGQIALFDLSEYVTECA